MKFEYIVDFGDRFKSFDEWKKVYVELVKRSSTKEKSGIDGLILMTGITNPVPGTISKEEIEKYNLSKNSMVFWVEDHLEESFKKAAIDLNLRLIKQKSYQDKKT